MKQQGIALEMTREQMIAYLNKFNVATFQVLRSWSDERLKSYVSFIAFGPLRK